MARNIITITTKVNNLVVRNPKTDQTFEIDWATLANTPPGLKYKSECINVLLRMVGASANDAFLTTVEAEALLKKTTEAARLLY